MAGDEGGEKSIPQSVPSKSSRFWEKLNLPWIHKKPTPEAVQEIDSRNPLSQPIIQQNPTEPTATLPSQEPPKKEKPQRQTGIGEVFINRLNEQGIIIETPEFESVGVAALGGTNEKGDPFLFEKVRKHPQAPNGYLIGIGAANIFSMLETFPAGHIPKAILLFDVDPQVVTAGQQLIADLRKSPNSVPLEVNTLVRDHQQIFRTGQMDYQAALIKYANIFHQLAKEGNIVIAQADFTDPRLIDELASLPNISELNNVVYLSNISDHLWRRNYRNKLDYTPSFDFLTKLQPSSPHKNYYIDTLTAGLSYNLRISTKIPNFSRGDFNYNFLGWQTKQTDEIDGITENPIWDDLSRWDIDKLLEVYEQTANKPIEQQRRKDVVESLTRMRQRQLESYPARKANPEDKQGMIPTKAILPDDPKKEEALLRDLAEPYDYDKDFIPFIAHTLWQQAKDPSKVDKYRFPERQLDVRDPNTHKLLYRVIDPFQWTKNQCEMWMLGDYVPYEELVMGKIYRELENRIKSENPGLNLLNRTFSELASFSKSWHDLTHH